LGDDEVLPHRSNRSQHGIAHHASSAGTAHLTGLS
jgi:hypothetical protein